MEEVKAASQADSLRRKGMIWVRGEERNTECGVRGWERKCGADV